MAPSDYKEGTTRVGLPIVRPGYLNGIKQGALSTISIGCHLFGIGGTVSAPGERRSEKVPPQGATTAIEAAGGSSNLAVQDEHHLSFTEEDTVLPAGDLDEEDNIQSPYGSNKKRNPEHNILSHASSLANLHIGQNKGQLSLQKMATA